jgi:hypothetical protein
MRTATRVWTSLDDGLAESGVTDEELTALALAADPEAPVDPDARSLFEVDGLAADALLPDWYMPALPGGRLLARPWQRRVVLFLVSAFLLIEGYGLCTTYGPIGPS